MATEVTRIADQLQRAYRGDAWHGTPVRELLADVTAETAAAHPIAHPHSIWQLTQHMAFWMEIARRRIEGETPELRDGDDWAAAAAPSEAGWQAVIAGLDRSHRDLLATVNRLSDADLERIVPVKGYTNYVLLHGVVQHTIYHAGQIAMLRRASGQAA